MGIYSYLHEYDDKNIEALFSNAVDLFNALGSWIYGGTSPKIVYPDLQLFIRKANNNTTESFSHLLEYINQVGNKLYKLLEENQWIEGHYYESFSLKQTNDVTTGLFFMRRIGWLTVKITDISNEYDVPILLQLHNAFSNIFNAFGRWIYHQEGVINITHCFQEFEKVFVEEFDSLYDEIIEEAKKTRKNIAKFLQKL